MANRKYRFIDPLGEVVEFVGPEGLTREQAAAYMLQNRGGGRVGENPQDILDEIDAREVTTGEQFKEFFKGIPAGAIRGVGTAVRGAINPLSERFERPVREGVTDVENFLAEFFSPDAGSEQAIGRKLGEGAGSLGTVALGAPLGLAGMAGIGAALGAGEASDRARASGKADEDQIAKAAALGLLPGLAEAAPLGRAFGAFGKLRNALGDEVATGIRDRLARVARTAGEEGLQEAGAQIAQNLIAQNVYDPATGTFTGTGESLGVGAGVGGLLQSLLELGIRGRPRGTLTPTADEETGEVEDAGPLPLPEQEQMELFPEDPRPTMSPFEPRTEREPELTQPDPDSPQGDMFGQRFVGPSPQEVAQMDTDSIEELLRFLGVSDAEIAAVSANDRQRETEEMERWAGIRPDEVRPTPPPREPQPPTFGDTEIDEIMGTQLREGTAQARSDNIRTGARSALQNQNVPRNDLDSLVDLVEELVSTEGMTTSRAAEVVAERAAGPARGEVRQQGELFGPRGGIPQTPRTTPVPRNVVEEPEPVEDAQVEALQLPDEPKQPDMPVTTRLMDLLGIPDRAPIRKAINGKNIQEQETVDQLLDYARQPSTRGDVRQRINTFVNNIDTRTRQMFGFEGRLDGKKPNVGRRQPEDRARGSRVRDTDRESGNAKADTNRRAANVPAGARRDAVDNDPASPADAKKRAGTKPDPLNKKKAAVTPEPSPLAKEAPKPAEPKPAPKPAEPAPAKEAPKPVREAPKAAEPKPAPKAKAASKPAPVKEAPVKEAPKAKTIDEVDALLNNPRVRDAETVRGQDKSLSQNEAAKLYFSSYGDKDSAIRAVAYESTGDMIDTGLLTGDLKESKGRSRFMNSKEAKKARAWIEKNGTAAQKKLLKENVDEFTRWNETFAAARKAEAEAKKMAAANKKGKKDREALADEVGFGSSLEAPTKNNRNTADTIDEFYEIYGDELGLDPDEMLYLSREGLLENGLPLPPSTKATIAEGDLKGALEALAGSMPDSKLGEFAKIFAGKLGNVKVRRVDPEDIEGGIGAYDPKTNSVLLTEDADVHTFLHEVAHALTAQTLDNKGHPLTKKLNKIYEDFKPRLSNLKGDYASISLEEFVAEYFGNEDFRIELESALLPGEARSPFQRVTDAIINFFRKTIGLRPTRGMTAGDLETTMRQLLAPQYQSFNSEMLFYGEGALNRAADEVGKYYNADNKGAAATRKFLDNFMGKTVGMGTFRGMLGSLPMPSFIDVAKEYYGDIAIQFRDAVSRYEGRINQINERVGRGTVKEFEDFQKNNPQKMEAMRRVLLEGSLNEIDFTKGESRYQGNMDRAKAYKELKPLFDSLGSDGQRMYREIRATYDRMYKEIIDQLLPEVEALSNGDKELAREVHNKFLNDLIKNRKGGLEGYFPFRRRGEFLLSYEYQFEGSNENVFMMFEDRKERDDLMAKLKDDKRASKIRAPLKIDKQAFRDAPSTSFVGQTLSLLEKNKASPEVIEKVMALAVDMTPQRSILKALKRRQGTLGFSEDVVDVYRETTMSLARQISSMQMSGEIKRLKDEIIAVQEKLDDNYTSEKIKAIGDELGDRIDLAVKPEPQPLSNLAKMFGYIYTLGLNLSSAIIDFFAIPMVIYPQLHNKYRGQNVFKAIMDATKLIGGSGRNYQYESYATEGMSDAELTERGLTRDPKQASEFYSIANYDFSRKDLPDGAKELKELVEVMQERGQFQRFSTYSDMEMVKEGKYMAAINSVMGVAMQMSERMRREATIIADYKLGIEKMKKELGKDRLTAEERQKVANDAIELSLLVNGSMSVLSNSRFGQLPGLSIAFMYKSYGARMMYLQFKMLKDIQKAQSPEDRRAAFQHFGMTMGIAALLSGARGMPFMGAVALLYNMFKDDEDDDFDTMMRRQIGTLGTEGVINTFTGINVAQRISLTDMMFRTDPGGGDKNHWQILAETIGGPVVGSADRIIRGVDYFMRGDGSRAAENILPPAFGNVMKSIRYGTEGARTRNGDAIMEDFSLLSIFAQAMGFSPSELYRRQQFISNQKRGERSMGEKRQLLLDKLYIARTMGDVDAIADIREEIAEFNADIQDPKFEIDRSTIDRSYRSRISNLDKKVMGITARNPAKWRQDAYEVLGYEE